MIKSRGYAAQNPTDTLSPFNFERRDPGENDVLINIKYCGICHSDVHQARDEWGGSIYPMVPGHEIVGIVEQVGSDVKKFKVGDTVGVGCMVDSCRTCHSCERDLEQFCESGMSVTYNGYEQDKITMTQGGYSNNIVVNEDFVLRVSPELELARVAPLLCAGITTYSPLKLKNVKPGDNVGIIGLGGLGHMAIKIAKAMGATVTVFSRSENKRDDAIKLGAHEVVISTNPEQMAAKANSLNLILDTVSGIHDINEYLPTLKLDGTLVMIGLPEQPLPLAINQVILPRRHIMGSLIGGIAETQEMLDFCAKHNILADIELCNIQDINEAYERLIKSDVKYRFVIDMESLEN